MPMIPAAQFPHLNGMSQPVIDGRHDGLHDFEFGLNLIVDGLATLLTKSGTAPSKRRSGRKL